ncbi:hypothetical protein BDV33DRAFT_186280 [Aspergillus novoparasiticus]|uniref:Uncharacterized protein n=1 Tax=Aspergillus novoparasiticus TaxID=986946 RepID=A0A5N6E5X2_9EURO|nr:hypothetical protein BDV33DRAFT_186280 [Aspergillus novoparasiticus]
MIFLTCRCVFMLNELSHGGDAKNLETAAIWQPDGSFILNTPNPGARKFISPSIPLEGIRRIALVFARLIVEEQDKGFVHLLCQLVMGNRCAKECSLASAGNGRGMSVGPQ